MTREEEIMEMALAFHEKCIGAPSAENPMTYEDAYVQGWKDADEHPKNPWISVEDRLPEPNNAVFVCKVDRDTNEMLDVWVAYIDGGKWLSFSYIRHDEIRDEITHWMPIP